MAGKKVKSLKKKCSMIMMLGLTALSLWGCGSINPDKYVTLGNYETLTVQVDRYTYTEEDLQQFVEYELINYVEVLDLYEYQTISANTVAADSLVNIDYVITSDGEAVESSAVQGEHYAMDAENYIKMDELIGKSVGETVVIDFSATEEEALYFGIMDPEEHELLMLVTINAIETRQMPAFDDGLIARMNLEGGITTMDQFKETFRVYLQDSCDSQNQTAKETAVWDAVYNICEVEEPPEELVNRFYEQRKQDYIDFASILEDQGMDTAEAEAEAAYLDDIVLELAKEEAKVELVYLAIAKKEGIKISDKQLTDAAEEEYQSYGYESAQAMIDDIGEEEYRSQVLRREVLERLSSTVTIVDGTVSPVIVIPGTEQ